MKKTFAVILAVIAVSLATAMPVMAERSLTCREQAFLSTVPADGGLRMAVEQMLVRDIVHVPADGVYKTGDSVRYWSIFQGVTYCVSYTDARIAELERKIKTIMPRDGRDGKDGRDGCDGASAPFRESPPCPTFEVGQRFYAAPGILMAPVQNQPVITQTQTRSGWDVFTGLVGAVVPFFAARELRPATTYISVAGGTATTGAMTTTTGTVTANGGTGGAGGSGYGAAAAAASSSAASTAPNAAASSGNGASGASP